MATYEQLMNAARNADAAGDEQAAARLVQMAKAASPQGGGLYSNQNQSMFPQPQAAPKINFMDPIQGDPTIMSTIADNVVGLDNGVMSSGEKLGTALNSAGESLTLGLVGDEAAGAADAMIGRGDYAARRDKYRKDQEQFQNENPKTAFAAELAPMLIPGVGAAGVAAKGVSAGSKLARAAGIGAASAGTYGFMEGEGGLGERAKQGAVSAALGGAVGAAAPKIIQKVEGIPQGLRKLMGAAEKRPTTATLKHVKNAAYKLVDDSGETFGPEDMQNLYGRVVQAFDDKNYVEEVDNASKAVLTILERRSGKPTTISQLDGIRQGLWKRYSTAKDQPQILDAIGAIDDLIDSRAATSELMGAARAANSKYAKAQLLERELMKDFDQAAATGSGGNIANKMRQTFTSIVNDERKARFFTADEIAKMREVIHPTRGEGALRLAGKLSPQGNGLMFAMHLIGGSATGGATLPIAAAGVLAKNSADRGVERKAQQAVDFMTGFAPQGPQLNPLALGAGAASAPIAENTANGLLEMFR